MILCGCNCLGLDALVRPIFFMHFHIIKFSYYVYYWFLRFSFCRFAVLWWPVQWICDFLIYMKLIWCCWRYGYRYVCAENCKIRVTVLICVVPFGTGTNHVRSQFQDRNGLFKYAKTSSSTHDNSCRKFNTRKYSYMDLSDCLLFFSAWKMA